MFSDSVVAVGAAIGAAIGAAAGACCSLPTVTSITGTILATSRRPRCDTPLEA